MRITLGIVFMLALTACFDNEIRPVQTGKKGNLMPEISLLLPDRTTYFSTTSLPYGKQTVMLYYSPDCPFCKAELESILDHMDQLEDIQFCLITGSGLNEMENFYKSYNLQEYPNVIAGRDTGFVFAGYFDPPGVPFTVFYNRSKKLKEAFVGGMEIKQIIALTKVDKNLAIK